VTEVTALFVERFDGVEGLALIRLEPVSDSRGWFARLYSKDVLTTLGLQDFDYCAVSTNETRGTIRGLHFQIPPFEEAKLVWCSAGALFDVVVDVRADSPSRGRWVSVELRPKGPALFVPKGFAHGFQTLESETAIQYHISTAYQPKSASGIRWDDPDLGIPWPIQPPTRISERDRLLPSLGDEIRGKRAT
jgi:dTDP-4-dehydrorhamnose 3,5-epimerase